MIIIIITLFIARADGDNLLIDAIWLSLHAVHNADSQQLQSTCTVTVRDPTYGGIAKNAHISTSYATHAYSLVGFI